MASFGDIVRKGTYHSDTEYNNIYCDRCRNAGILEYVKYGDKDLCMFCCGQIAFIDDISKETISDDRLKRIISSINRASYIADLADRPMAHTTRMASTRFPRPSHKCIIS